MTSRRIFLAASFLSAALAFPVDAQTLPAGLSYPVAVRGTEADDFHGTRVADPYRWLENTSAPETKAWVEAENRLTFAYLGAIPERAAIRNRLEQLWNYPKYAAPRKYEDRLFYSENSGLLNQSIYYVQDGTRPARVLIDPNTLSADGTVALSVTEPSWNGRFLGYAVSTGGSDWQEIRIRSVDNGRDLADTLKWVKFSGIAWTRDNKGFFYSGYDAETAGNKLTNVVRNQRVYYHKVGTPQSRDQIIYERKDRPDWLFQTQVNDEGNFAIITIFQGTDSRTRLYLIDLDNPKKPKINAPVVRLIDDLESENQYVYNMGDFFIVKTDRRAPRGQIVQIDINNPEPRRWVTVIPEQKESLQFATVAGRQLVLEYLQDAHSALRVHGMPDLTRRMNRAPQSTTSGTFNRPQGNGSRRTGTDRMQPRGPGYGLVGEIKLPGIGSITGISARPNDDEMFYSFESFTSPAAIHRYDMKRQTNEIFKEAKLPVDISQFETRQIFYTSKDGTRVPMFITMKKGLTLDGSNPTILSGYGGFNISRTPAFSAANLVWMEMGGIYAVANIRGGGEYGKDWHEAGMLGHKQNVFDDFIAAAEYLIKEKYTSTPKLAISGASNGGLLVGAVMTQRPELFGAALPAVGVMDMLRFQKFTIGWAWVSDYGSADDPKQFPFLFAYSPLHNIKPGTKYPATLVTTADNDDRVVPGHSFKFAAALQAAQAGAAPVLIRIETHAGHGGDTPTSKRIDEAADKFAFLVKNLDMRVNLH